jgi:hypothetical protein
MKTSLKHQASQSLHPMLFRFAASLDNPDLSHLLRPKLFGNLLRNPNYFSFSQAASYFPTRKLEAGKR